MVTVRVYRYMCRKQKFAGEAAVRLAVSRKKPISRINDKYKLHISQNYHRGKTRFSVQTMQIITTDLGGIL